MASIDEAKKNMEDLQKRIDYLNSSQGKHGAEYAAIRKVREKKLPELQKQLEEAKKVYEQEKYKLTPEGKIEGAKETIEKKAKDSEKTFADLQKQASDLAKQQAQFRDEQIKEAEKLSKWHSNLATDYKTYLSRIKDEIKEVEKDFEAKKERLQAASYANTSMLSQASLAGMRGRAMTGSQQAVVMASAQRRAGDDYNAAMERLESMQAQKEQMMAQVASQAMGLQMNAIQAGAAIEGQQIAAKANAQNIFTQNQLQNLGVISGLEQTKFEASTLPELMTIQSSYHDKELWNQLQIAQIQSAGAVAQANETALGNTMMASATGAGIGFLTAGPIGAVYGAIGGALTSPSGLKQLPVVGGLFRKLFK